MQFKLRDYQQKASDAAVYFFNNKAKKTNAIMVLPTGSGKSLIIADIAARLDGHTLVFQPSKEILEQNFKKLCSYGILDCSIYSASFNSKEISRITFATIGSVKNHPELFTHFRNIIVDECFTGKTEILTEKGFVRFDELKSDLKVAEFNDGVISFVFPKKHIRRFHDGEITSFHIKNDIDVPMTNGHMQVFWKEGIGFFKEEIAKAYFGNKRKIPVSGMSDIGSNDLSDLERLYIAVQANGSIHKYYDDYVTISFTLKKDRKISRLIHLCNSVDIPLSEVKCNHGRRFMVKMPKGTTKDISNHIQFPMSSKKAMQIVEECVLWDGSIVNDKGLYYYSSTDKKQVDFYNAVATISGNSCYVSQQNDNRSKNHNTVYRLFIRTNTQLKDTQQMKKQPDYYKGYVYCVEVPSGAIVVRHKGYTFISGNCHLVNPKEGMYKKFFEVVNCKVLGLTATPYRLSSSRDFGFMLKFITRTKPHVFSEVIYYVQVSTLLNMGYLAKLNYYPMDKELKKYNGGEFKECNLKRNSTGADYTDESVKEEYERINFYGFLTSIVKRLLDNQKTGAKRNGILVFTRFMKEAQRLANSIPGCAVISGDVKITPKAERERILSAFKSGQIKVLANVGVLTTGFDYPELDTVVMARPTMSLAMWYQIVGRAIRPHPNKEAGWIVDLCGNINRFGYVENLKLVDGGNGKWAVFSNGRQLTNIRF